MANTELATSDVRDYLGMVVDTEANLYMQKDLIDNLERKQSKLGIKKSFVEPEKPVEPQFDKSKSILKAVLCFLGCMAFQLFCIGHLFLIDAIIILISLFVYFNDKIKYNKAFSKYNDKLSIYNIKLSEYNNSVNADNERVAKECEEKELTLAALGKLKEQNTKTKQTLSALYSTDILYPKYRNFAMASTIYEYLDSGRCTTLEGRDGAYNMLETEIRLDRIITKVDEVIDRLDTIATNQSTLYNAISHAMENSNRIVNSIDSLSIRMDSHMSSLDSKLYELNKNSELSAYNAERMEKELHYMNWMKHLNGDYKYSDIFNLPN